MAESEKKKPLGAEVSPETQQFLDDLKKDGFAKGEVIDKALAIYRWLFFSTKDLKGTKNEVMYWRLLQRVRDRAKQAGASPNALAELDRLVEDQNRVVLSLEKGGSKK